jgi:hypothetical protein
VFFLYPIIGCGCLFGLPAGVNAVVAIHLSGHGDAENLNAVTKIGYKKVDALSSWQAPEFVQKRGRPSKAA